MKKNKKLFYLLLTLFSLWGFSMCTSEEDIVVQVESLKLSKGVLILAKGEKAKLDIEVSPLNAKDYSVNWYVSDNSVITVVDGEVTAVGVGEATVTAKCGTIASSSLVKVVSYSIPLKSMGFVEKEIDLEIESSLQLTLKLVPENTTEQINWSSSDEMIATVFGGKVFGRAEGSAIITAMAGDKKVSVKVNVVAKPAKVSALKLSPSAITIEEGDVKLLEVDVKSNEPEKVNLVWSSSDENVVKVLNGRITGIAKGKAVVTVAAGELEDTCEVEVIDKSNAVRTIKIGQDKVTMKVKQTANLVAFVEPEEFIYQMEWSSENEEIATVSQHGVVSSLKAGVTQIYVTAGGKQASCTIEVQEAFEADDFKITISNITPLEAHVEIKAPTEETGFTCGLMRKSVYDEIVARHGSIMAANTAYWETFGDNAFINDLKIGEYKVRLTELSSAPIPNVEYILYCYGVDKNTKETTSPLIEKTFFTLPSVTSDNKITFVNKQVTDSGITGQIKTTNMDGYYITLQKKRYVDSYEEKYKNNVLIDGLDARTYMFQACISGDLQYASMDKLIRHGDLDIVDGYFPPKKGNREYVLMIIGYDIEKGFCTDPVYVNFTTLPKY